MKKRYLLFYLLVPVLFMVNVSFAAGDAAGLLEGVNRRYLEAGDIEIRFRHETFFAELEETSVGTGMLYIKKPGMMRWSYQTPNVQDIYIKGNEVTHYSKGLQQVVMMNLDVSSSSLVPLKLLMGDVLVSGEFDITSHMDDGVRSFSLLPKKGTLGQIIRIVLEVKTDIRKVVVYMKNDNISSFYLSGYKWNKGIDNDMFRFVPGDDISIIDER